MKPFFPRLWHPHPAIRLMLPVFLIPALGAFVGISTQQGVDGWYQNLMKLPFTPPDWVFGAVWTVLYILMGLSFGMLWQKAGTIPASFFRLFALQLILNLIWSYLFFRLHWLWISAMWICGLIGLVGYLVRKIWPHHRPASILLWPYLCWMGFALILSFGIVILNG